MSPSAISLYLSKIPTRSLLYERSCFMLYTYFNTLSLISLAFFTVSLKEFILSNSGSLLSLFTLSNSSLLYPASPLIAGQTLSSMIQNCSYDPVRNLDSILNALYSGFCSVFAHIFLKFIYYFVTHFLPFITHAYNQSYDSE